MVFLQKFIIELEAMQCFVKDWYKVMLVQGNVGHLWCVHCNGLLEKQESERQKAILEVPTQLLRIALKNMKRRQLNYLMEYITFIYEN